MIFASPLARGLAMAVWWIPIEMFATFCGTYIAAWLMDIPAPWWPGLAVMLLFLALSLPPYVILVAAADAEYWRNKPTYTAEPYSPEPEHGFHRMMLVTDNTTQFFTVRCTTKQLIAVTSMLAESKDLSGRRFYEGKGRVFSQNKYREFVHDLIRQKLAERVGTTTILTDLGARAFAQGHCSPTLNGDDA